MTKARNLEGGICVNFKTFATTLLDERFHP